MRSVVLLTYDGAEALDVVGPAAVFSNANRLSGQMLYKVLVAAADGRIDHSGGIVLEAKPLSRVVIGPRTTVLVAGAQCERALAGAMADHRLLAFLGHAAAKAERYGSICSGTFVLAAARLLDGKRVTTHWEAQHRLAAIAGDCTVDGQALYVTDGKLWTSAGATTGIDMALAILAADHGHHLKSEVAKRLVVYSHRPGTQSQFSTMLDVQQRAGASFGVLVDWLQSRLPDPTSVDDMARHCRMSPRNFHRRFVAVFGQTPAQVFDAMRLDYIRQQIEQGLPIGLAADRAGYRSEAAFRRAFRSRFGISPGLYRQTARSGP